MAGKPGRSGRTRKPTALLKLHGDYRKDRHGDRAAEPQPKGKPVKPKRMDKDASEHWDQVVPGLIETGVATAADQAALIEMCDWWSKTRQLQRKKGLDYKTLQTAAMCTKRWLELAKAFGLTPVDRARIQVGEKEAADPAAEYIA